MVKRLVHHISLHWQGHQMTLEQAVAAATAGLLMLHSAALSLRNPLLFFSPSPSLATGPGTPCSLCAHVSVWPQSTSTLSANLWNRLLHHYNATELTRKNHKTPVRSTEHLYSGEKKNKKRCSSCDDVTTLCVWAKSSTCFFAVKICDR